MCLMLAGGCKSQPLQISVKVAIDTKKEVAKVANVSHDTIAKYTRLLNNGKYMKTRGLGSKHAGDVDYLLTL